MKIIRKAQSGSFESSDIIVLVEPITDKSGRVLEIESTVMQEYGELIENVIKQKLDEFEIEDIHLIAKDKGALDFTIEARVETAIIRATKPMENSLNL